MGELYPLPNRIPRYCTSCWSAIEIPVAGAWPESCPHCSAAPVASCSVCPPASGFSFTAAGECYTFTAAGEGYKFTSNAA